METINKSVVQPDNSLILQGKHAVLFGAGGSFGSVVARKFAAEGAEVFLSGRTKSNVEDVVRQINDELIEQRPREKKSGKIDPSPGRTLQASILRIVSAPSGISPGEW